MLEDLEVELGDGADLDPDGDRRRERDVDVLVQPNDLKRCHHRDRRKETGLVPGLEPQESDAASAHENGQHNAAQPYRPWLPARVALVHEHVVPAVASATPQPNVSFRARRTARARASVRERARDSDRIAALRGAAILKRHGSRPAAQRAEEEARLGVWVAAHKAPRALLAAAAAAAAPVVLL
jgi:hypothetical protein